MKLQLSKTGKLPSSNFGFFSYVNFYSYCYLVKLALDIDNLAYPPVTLALGFVGRNVFET